MVKSINSAHRKSYNVFLSKFFLLLASIYIVLGTSQPSAAKPPKSTLNPPASVRSEPISEHQNDLRWQYDSNKIDGFSIERSETPDTGFSEIAIANPTATSYLDSGLAGGKSYFYRMRAFKNAGNDTTYSYYSETVSATTTAGASTPGSFAFGAASYSVGESNGKIDITIQRLGGSDGQVTVDWRTLTFNGYGTADRQADYTTVDPTTLTFADSETSKSVSVFITSDSETEEDETFTVLLQNPTGGATLDTVNAATVTILDDDSATTASPGAFAFDVASYAVNEGVGTVDITINRVGGSAGVATVDWRTKGITASFGKDYGDFSWTTLTFADGETSKTKSIAIIDDTEVEGDETFDVLLGNSTGGATLDTITTTRVTIADNDSTTTDSTGDSTATTNPGAFTFEAASYAVDEGGGTVDITINRVGGSAGVATIDWRTKGVTATYGEDYGDFNWTTLTFADGETSKTKSIAIVDDTRAESDETFNVLLGNATGGATLGTTTSTTVTIADNDESSTAEPASDSHLGYLPVFPGAQGFGTETKAGRGGKIIKVTNLNDSGSGSLRAALETSGPRIVVFEVSGTITLTSPIRIRNPYLTLAGQTAPSPGITVKGSPIDIRTHDILIQHIRSRVGDSNPGGLSLDGIDAMQMRENLDTEDVSNVILNHVSLSWGVDENLGVGGRKYAHSITVSDSIISEGLSNSIHPKGEHSKGILIGDRTKKVSLVGNLIAHHKDRNGACWKGDTSGVALNNLIYNSGNWNNYYVADDYNSGPSYLSIVGNDSIDGVDTPSSNHVLAINSNISSGTKIYFTGNRITSGQLYNNRASFDPRVSSPPVWHPSLTVRDTSTVKSWVLANAGARPADRDSVDERVVNEVKSRTGNIIDNPQEVGGWPNLSKNYRSFAVPTNPNGDDDGDGYTNIEEVLHQMAAKVEGK